MIDVDAAIAVGQRWAEFVEDAALYEIRLRVEDVVYAPEQVRAAFDILTSDLPLARRYPNGSPAIPPFTPRQVLLLANREWRPPITHETTGYQRAHNAVRESLGRQEPRRCRGATARGRPCQAYALPYIADDRLCWNHSGVDEQRRNADMVQREEEMLRKELDKLN
jgi:hypothetical protein